MKFQLESSIFQLSQSKVSIDGARRSLWATFGYRITVGDLQRWSQDARLASGYDYRVHRELRPLGCIGITDINAKSFHNAIKQTAPSIKLTIQVK